jgi:K+-sensing histidine kinase KdpD
LRNIFEELRSPTGAGATDSIVGAMEVTRQQAAEAQPVADIGETSRAAVVADLLTSQANHIASLKWAVGVLESKITLRNSLAEVQAEALREPFRQVLEVLSRIKDALAGTQDENLRSLQAHVEEGIEQVNRAIESIAHWLSTATDPTILYPREALKRVPLRQVVERALADLGPSFDRSRLELVLPPGEPVITTAPARLAAMITALLDNAVKYGGPGRIECICSITAQSDLKVIVKDRGPGLRGVSPEEYFKPKPREASEDKEWQPLLGLGLFLTKMMAESLGGSVTLEDREGGGLVATITLPQRRRRDITIESAGHRV